MKTEEELKVAIEGLKQRQLNGEQMPCPRCGEERMRTPATHNCLSRQADIYVCEVFGAEEAVYAMKGIALPFEYWIASAQFE